MNQTLYSTIRVLRPRQWIKNFAIFAAITFSGKLFDPTAFNKVFLGFIIFCGLSSSIYIINDILDIQRDKLHPFKRFRPIAHGDISVFYATVFAAVMAFISLWAGLFISYGFFFLILTYFI